MNRGILVAAALSALPFSAWADEQPQPLEAGKENTGRISVINGQDLFGRGPYDEETWELSINAVVREGDELFTEDGTYAEVELPGGTFLRLDGETTIVLQRVSEQSVEVALAEGSVYVSRGSNAQPVMVQTFGGAIEMGGNSMARVGTDRNKTQIEVRTAKGSAEMRSEKTAIAVPETKSLVWTRSGSRNDNWSTATYDDFDRWNQKREDTVRGTSRPANVASNAMGAYELEGQGTWVMIDGYYAWRPTVVVADWRPYSNGYWSWCEPWGWTWVDYYGWGYTTSHYGRWYYRSHYGWVWYPDAYWGGSYVVWAAFGPHIGWAPCDYWGRPIYVYSYYSYYDYGAWCYSDADYFYTGGGYRPRGVRTSTSRTAGGGGRMGSSVGRSGTHQIRTFTAETIRQHSPVPVRDARAELTPKNIADAAGRGQIKGVRAEQRGGQFLSRAVKEGGVKPEPWSDRGGRDAFNSGSKSGRTGMTDPSGGRDPGRAAEGWGRGGSSTDANRGGNDLTPGRSGGAWNSNDRGGSSQPSYDRGGSSNDRGSSQPSYDRGGSNDRGSSQPSYDRGGSSNDRGSQSQPSRGGNDSGSSKSRDSGSSKKSTPPPKQDNDSNKKSNDSKPKPRSSWSDTTASAGREGWGKRGEKSARSSQPSYNYNGRDSAPSASSKGGYSSRGNSGGSSYSAPSRSNGGSSTYSAPSYSAPSRSSGRSSAPSYSAPKSNSSNGGGRSYSSGSSSKSSGSSSKSSSSGGSRSSSSSSSSKSSSSSSKSSGGKRGR